MLTLNADLAISFPFDGMTIQIINLKHEHILQELPLHNHGSDCYEIHYLSGGYGKLCAAGKEYDIGPNTLFTTGPHVMHAQQPDPKDPMKEFCIYLKVIATARPKDVSPPGADLLPHRLLDRAGHAGHPWPDENALLRAGAYLDRLPGADPAAAVTNSDCRDPELRAAA